MGTYLCIGVNGPRRVFRPLFAAIVFEIARVDGHTEVRFTHVGLVPEYECYAVCSDGWSTYIDSLRELVMTGKGQPNVGEAKTGSEQALVRSAGGRS